MNIFAFPFYNKRNKQVRFTTCAAAASGALIGPKERWLPFMLTLPKTGEGIDCVNIWNVDDTLFSYVTPDKFQFDLYSDGIVDYIFYYGGKVAGLNLPCGQQFYLEVKGFFSEVFQVVDNLCDYLKIEWKHKLPVGPAIYQTGFVNRLYVDAIIAEPIYKLEEEGDEDGYGVFLPTRSRLEKTFKFDITPLPEFLVDALAAAPLHNSIIIGSHNLCREVKISPDWDKAGSSGCSAVISVEFNEDYPVEADYCGNPAAISAVDLTNYVPKTWLCSGAPNPTPNWVATSAAPFCEVVNGNNTGYLMQEQIDINSNSPSYQQTRTVRTVKDVAACPPPQVFSSQYLSDFVYKNDCPAGSTGSGVPVSLAAGYIMDVTSQADVDARASNYFNSMKQDFANQNGTCVYPPTTGDDFAGCVYGSDGCWGGFVYTTGGGTRVYKDLSECNNCVDTTGIGHGGNQGICTTIACI